MAKVTLSIPKDIKEKMDALPEVNWPEVLRRVLGKRLEKLKKLERM